MSEKHLAFSENDDKVLFILSNGVRMEPIHIFLLFSMTLLVCVCSTKLSTWIKMPVLIVFLGIGMMIEPDESFPFRDNPQAANWLGTVAMIFILFSGGFNTKWASVKKVAFRGMLLSTLGVLLSALFVGLFTYFYLKWIYPTDSIPIFTCLLLGSIISSTDAAAVFSVLRSKSVSLSGQLSPLLELESGSNDPMAALMTIILLPIAVEEAKTGKLPSFSVLASDLMTAFFFKMTFGLLIGLIWGKLMAWLFNKINLEYDGLYYVLGITSALIAFSGTESLNGNGFMAVYVCGLAMGNTKFIYHNGLGRFHDGISWLMQVVLFSMLGMLCNAGRVWNVRGYGLAVALFLMLAARPLAVFICMIGSKFNYRERTLISWVGLRGGAPIMLATFPLAANLEVKQILFDVVFFIVLTSIVLQGTTIMPLARRLKLDLPLRIHPRIPLEFENTGNMDGETKEFEILAGSKFIGMNLAHLGLPKGALVLLIRRGGGFIVPHGDTKIQENDGLMILGSDYILAETGKVFGISSEE